MTEQADRQDETMTDTAGVTEEEWRRAVCEHDEARKGQCNCANGKYINGIDWCPSVVSIARAVLAILPKATPGEWQPIETAPESGPILVWTGNANRPTIFYASLREYGPHKRPGWWIVSTGLTVEPTHWTPLPSPPGSSPKAAPGEWQPIETAPESGAFLLANALGQVCAADSRDGHRIVHNVPGYADWTWPQRATHWMPLPSPPDAKSKEGSAKATAGVNAEMLAALNAVQGWLDKLHGATSIPGFPKDEVDAAVLRAEPASGKSDA